MSHMSSGFYRDRLGFDPNKESNNTAGQQASAQVAMSASSMSRRTVTSASAAYSSSSLSRQETQMSSRHVQSSSSDRQSAAGHYAVSSHVSNGNLVVDNGNGVIQAQSGNHYEENLGKIKGRATDFWIIIIIYFYPYLILKGLTFHVDIFNLCC